MFNQYQSAYMRELEQIPPEQKCYCGWYRLGKCPHCPPNKTCADKLRDRGSAVPSSVCTCNMEIDGTEHFDVAPLRFYDQKTQRQMLYVYPDTKHWCAGWILYKTTGGAWATLRKATDADIEAMSAAVIGSHHSP